MAAKKGPKRQSVPPKAAASRIISAVDTSGTVRPSRSSPSDATRISTDDYELGGTYYVGTELEPGKYSVEPTNGVVSRWIKHHWEILAGLGAAIATVLVFATKLDAKVDVLSSDVKEVKTSVDKLKIDAVRTSTQVEQLQRSVGRIEDQRTQQKR